MRCSPGEPSPEEVHLLPNDTGSSIPCKEKTVKKRLFFGVFSRIGSNEVLALKKMPKTFSCVYVLPARQWYAVKERETKGE